MPYTLIGEKIKTVDEYYKDFSQAGFDVNCDDATENIPLLHCAIKIGNSNALQALTYLKDKIVINRQDTKNNRTALHYACEAGKLLYISLLIEEFSKGEECLDLADIQGNKPFDLLTDKAVRQRILLSAASCGKSKIVKLLIDSSKKLNFNAHDLAAELNVTTENHWTPLHKAVYAGNLEVVTLLLNTEAANKEATTADGNTPLHIAAAEGHLEIVALLLRSTVDKEAKTNNGDTPLHLVASSTQQDPAKIQAQLRVVALLVEGGADKNARTAKGNTPLHLSALNGNFEIYDSLLLANADIHAKNDDGKTPGNIKDEMSYSTRSATDIAASENTPQRKSLWEKFKTHIYQHRWKYIYGVTVILLAVGAGAACAVFPVLAPPFIVGLAKLIGGTGVMAVITPIVQSTVAFLSLLACTVIGVGTYKNRHRIASLCSKLFSKKPKEATFPTIHHESREVIYKTDRNALDPVVPTSAPPIATLSLASNNSPPPSASPTISSRSCCVCGPTKFLDYLKHTFWHKPVDVVKQPQKEKGIDIPVVPKAKTLASRIVRTT